MFQLCCFGGVHLHASLLKGGTTIQKLYIEKCPLYVIFGVL